MHAFADLADVPCAMQCVVRGAWRVVFVQKVCGTGKPSKQAEGEASFAASSLVGGAGCQDVEPNMGAADGDSDTVPIIQCNPGSTEAFSKA